MDGFEYVKVMLYAYPKLDELAYAVAEGAEVKAALSFRSYDDTFTLLEKIANEVLLSQKLRGLKRFLDGVLASFSEEERFLLEYKYFRRKKILRQADMCLPCSERSYFRRQTAVFRKVCSRFLTGGWTEQKFMKEFSSYLPFMRFLKALREGKERTIKRKRTQRELVFQKSESSRGSAVGRLPRITMTAITTAATHTRQMTTTCTAEIPFAPPAVASSGGGR